MKIYIVGSVGSGKSTLARRISKAVNIPCYHLDEVVYQEDPSASWGNRKRPTEVRDELFNAILSKDHYIMEDAGRACFIEGMRQADRVILLEIPLIVRQKRILTRWIKQNLKLEACIYKPRFEMLNSMLKWAKNYDSGADKTKERVSEFQGKTILIRTNKEIEDYLKGCQPYADGDHSIWSQRQR